MALAERLSEASEALEADELNIHSLDLEASVRRIFSVVDRLSEHTPKIKRLIHDGILSRDLYKIIRRYNFVIGIKHIVLESDIASHLDEIVDASARLGDLLGEIDPTIAYLLSSRLQSRDSQPILLSDLALILSALSRGISEIADIGTTRRPADFALAQLIPELKAAVQKLCGLSISSVPTSRNFQILVELAQAVNPSITSSQVASQFFGDRRRR